MTATTDNDIYQQALQESVHFSFKTINSNIDKGGLRLGKAQALDLPYVSARTLLHEQFLIPTDYQANAGKTASIFKVIKAAMLDEDISEQDAEFQQHVTQLKPALDHIFDTPYQSGTADIDIRMRQLLLPKDSAQQQAYISISPLTAAGVNHLLNQQVDDISIQAKEKDAIYKRIQNAVFGIGGANPQNVGSLVRAMQRPITLSAPENNADVSKAFKIFYKGFDYFIPNKILVKGDEQIIPDLILWAQLLHKKSIETAQNKHQNWTDLGIHSPETNMKVRKAEMVFLKNIVSFVLYQADQHLQVLKAAADKLPIIAASDQADATYNDSTYNHSTKDNHEQDIDKQSTDQKDNAKHDAYTPLLHSDVSFLKKALIVPELRDDYWRINFADDLAQDIIGQSFILDVNQPEIAIPLDNNAKGYLARRLREILR